MFQNGMMAQQSKQQVNIAGPSIQQANSDSNATDKNSVYQITKDTAKADIVVNQPDNKKDTNDPSAPDDTNHDDGNNNNTNDNNNGNHDNDNGNGDNNGDHSDNNNNDNKDQDDTNNDDDNKPTKRPSDTAKDPQSNKKVPSNSLFPTKPFVDTITPITDDDTETGDNRSVIIQQAEDNINATLYKGQSVKEKDLFNALDTYVYGKDNYTYAWGDSAYEHYIKIEGVSFDGGKTWTSEYPVTIPSDLESGNMKIKVDYRLSEKKNWITRIVDYEPKDSRIFLLSQKITEENTTITDDMIVNKYQQHLNLGETMNLYKMQSDFLGYDRLTSLFPGWMENGQLQPWFYKAEEGRHILEPADMVSLDNKYVVKLKVFWMTNDQKIDPDGNQLVYLQTLTDMNDVLAVSWLDANWLGTNLYNVLSVPKYTQAIAIDSDANLSVNYLEVSDTVLYIKLDDSGMRVNEGYKVDENNANYTSTDAGILLTKDKTEIIGIPYNTKKLEIGKDVTKVRIEDKNQLSEIDLSQKSLDEIKNIDYSKLHNCKLIVKDDILSSYIQQNYKSIFANQGNTVAAASNPNEEYMVEKGTIINKHKRMVMAIEEGKEQLNFTTNVNSIAKDAFRTAKSIKRLVMPENGNSILFEKNSLRDCNINTIQCYTKDQYDSIVKQLEDAGASQDLVVQLINTSKEGYKYCMQGTEEGNETILMSVPRDITQFDGVMTTLEGEKISITQIGAEAFAECKNLKWVTLSESVKKIGIQAFKNCTNLEGMLIDSKDVITIGDESLDGCTSLRFVGSNAKKGIMENDYEPNVTDSYGADRSPNIHFYVPGNCEGYNQSCLSVTSGSQTPITGYCMQDLNNTTKALYGVDENKNPWILMRSGKDVSDHVKLPEQTKEIFNYAMADTVSKTGKYTIGLQNVTMIDGGAFYNSGISGDITFHDNVLMFDSAMRGCKNITSVTLPGNAIYLGDDVFNDCINLKSARLGKLLQSVALRIGVFTGCDNLTDLTFESKTAEQLGLSGDSTFPYQFNTDWTKEEEASKLRIHVPQGSQISYIKGWRYIYCGYVEMHELSPYDAMRQDIYFNNLDWTTWEGPSDEEIDVIQKEKLLDAENRIRQMIGMSQTEQPTDLYLYHTSNDGFGFLTLVDATTKEQEINLGTADLELPEGWYLDYLGTGAFKNAKNLTKLTIPDNMSGIKNKAFEGLESGKLELCFEAKTPLKLMLDEEKQPYEFGLSDEQIHIKVPENLEEEYLRAWIFPMYGYEDVSSMMWDVMEQLSDDGDSPEMETVYKTMAEKLLPVENRLRTMMGMDQISSIYEMCYKDDWNLSKTENKQETEEKDKKSDQEEKETQNSSDERENSKKTDVNQTKDEQEHKDNIKQITILQTTTQLESDAYSEEKSDQLELTFEAKTPLKLHLKEEGTAFSFGKDDDKITIHVPEGCENSYIEQWKYAMAGYENLESMKQAVIQSQNNEELTQDQIDEIISQKLLLAENRLRKMMKMEELEK